MKRTILILLSLMIGLLVPNLALADCLDLGNFTSWFRQDNHTIIIYRGARALAILKIPDCDIQPGSSIRLLRSYVCDSDKIIINGAEYSIWSVQSLS